jgi:rare lipoprotein A
MTRKTGGILSVLLVCASLPALADPPPPNSPQARATAEQLDKLPPVPPQPAGHIDPSGRKQEGRASYYGPGFVDRKMADGHRMNPDSNVAASKTLPLGSVAKVVNLKNGKEATVRVEDRGPYVKGRVVDLTPAVADKLGMKKQGVAPVVVKPITVPQPDGAIKLGAGAADASPAEVAAAAHTTKELTDSRMEEASDR